MSTDRRKDHKLRELVDSVVDRIIKDGAREDARLALVEAIRREGQSHEPQPQPCSRCDELAELEALLRELERGRRAR